jgi:hypothetical protein
MYTGVQHDFHVRRCSCHVTAAQWVPFSGAETAYLSRIHEFTLISRWVSCCSILSFRCGVLWISVCIFASFFFLPLY